ncbi:hypothetical protein AO896_07320 [Pseudomonas aeruginosa]|uniref:Uncharacterized protein n=1 Tax=Pseudomonas paraeruginosa (strain DSM 24068 / PA7) TaxID=381754 RepID=A6VE88_PSEP7|nr:hypothetical protein PSPA7_6057 [Pseudomonas aeruginosa PA7]ALY43169.1 hypothetical protein HW09_20260 [Pseudomonas aeruginosa]ETU86374.1 hypothetical protein Q094_04388 [Pseudomonas aeruginosa PS42]KEA11232.1 hypothetical protein BH77_29200 [Pseudomonas aeruginosa C2773C]SCZ11480.1 Uncharacterised protein [Acinetobacter baumannii]
MLDSLRTNALQVVKNLLIKISQADDLAEACQLLNTAPSRIPSILGFINNDYRMSVCDQLPEHLTPSQ